MSGELPHPLPIAPDRAGVPEFATRHLAAEFVARYQAQGHIRRCAHLGVDRVAWGPQSRPVFGPTCARDSFTVAMGAAFYGCPEDCRFYRRVWAGRLLRILAGAWVGAAAPFRWFERQQPIVKVALILLAVVLALVGFHADDAFVRAIRATVDVIREVRALF